MRCTVSTCKWVRGFNSSEALTTERGVSTPLRQQGRHTRRRLMRRETRRGAVRAGEEREYGCWRSHMDACCSTAQTWLAGWLLGHPMRLTRAAAVELVRILGQADDDGL